MASSHFNTRLVFHFDSEIVHHKLYVAFHIIDRYHIFIILAYIIVAKRVILNKLGVKLMFLNDN